MSPSSIKRSSPYKTHPQKVNKKKLNQKNKKTLLSDKSSLRPRKLYKKNTSKPRRPITKEQGKESSIRLNKYIANGGVGSRRQADEMIRQGLVSVNGKIVTEMGCKVKISDIIRYQDSVVKAEPFVYLLLNKPKGFITTTSDPQNRKTIMSLIDNACKQRVYPVGRLDRNTTGLLLLSNDGALASKLTHPSYKAKKIYKAVLNKPITKNDFEHIQRGVKLEEGTAIVDDLAVVGDDRKIIGIELHIGWNRIIHRIFEALEYEVIKLDRVIYAGLDKKNLPRGTWRFLKPEEIFRLKNFK